MTVSVSKKNTYIYGRWMWEVKINIQFEAPQIVDHPAYIVYFKESQEATQYIVDTLKLASLPQVREYTVML